jgi:uncharacterized protein (UPF0332 family)
MTPEKQALAQRRLERAREAIEEARLLFEAGHLHACVDRLCCACSYAISALLLTRGLSMDMHILLLRAFLHREFVQPGMIPLEYERFIDLLFNNCQKSESSDFVVFQGEQVKGWLQQSREFVKCVSGLLAQ